MVLAGNELWQSLEASAAFLAFGVPHILTQALPDSTLSLTLQQAVILLAWALSVRATRMNRPGIVTVVSSRELLHRDTAVAYLVIGLLGVFVVHHIFVQRINVASLLLVLVAMAAFTVRENLNNHRTQQLVTSLTTQALEDPLTGLGNRRALGARLETLVQSNEPAVVIVFNLDRFKDLNAEHGNLVGDRVIQVVGEHMRTSCTVGTGCYRLGSDEFVLVVSGSLAHAQVLAERLRVEIHDAVRGLPELGDTLVTASAGLAAITDQDSAEDALAVLIRAGMALKLAKTERNRVRLYSLAQDEQARREAAIARRLRVTLESGRGMDMHYQPILDLQTDQVRAFEALARWEDEELGRVNPAEFVPIAEQTGLIHELGLNAIDQSMGLAVWAAKTGYPVYISVNVSPLQLRRAGFVEIVEQTLANRGAEPWMLAVEVTESIFMDLDDPAVQSLERLHELGVAIAIDDFGSGYSSLGYMGRLPASILKVDRSITEGILSPQTAPVIHAITAMTQALGLTVVMEGVETRAVADGVRRAGAELGQGWLWSPAVPATEVREVLTRFRAGRKLTR